MRCLLSVSRCLLTSVSSSNRRRGSVGASERQVHLEDRHSGSGSLDGKSKGDGETCCFGGRGSWRRIMLVVNLRLQIHFSGKGSSMNTSNFCNWATWSNAKGWWADDSFMITS